MTFRQASLPPLPDEVIDRLFSALYVRYGAPFVDRWRDLDLSVVKGDWAMQLAGFGKNLEALRYGLEHLPEKPPTVFEFRRICNGAPGQHDPNALVYNRGQVRGPTQEERDALRALARGTVFAAPGKDWARDLLQCHAIGERNGQFFKATQQELTMAREALGAKDGGDD